MLYTESEESFWKAHSMGCGYRGEFKRKQVYPDDPVTYECPKCGSEYRPEQELNGQFYGFAGDSVDMFTRVSDQELKEELENRGYKLEKKPDGWWQEAQKRENVND
ncbi:MAG: hypothetical protein QUS12_10850 [Methanosarcina sp.]|nr:hypothetical protein [Methanosarcina sp.]